MRMLAATKDPICRVPVPELLRTASATRAGAPGLWPGPTARLFGTVLCSARDARMHEIERDRRFLGKLENFRRMGNAETGEAPDEAGGARHGEAGEERSGRDSRMSSASATLPSGTSAAS